MRITSHYLLNNFKLDQQNVNKELKKVTEQISSGKKIQKSYEDPTVFNDTLKLDTHINQLKGVQDRTQKAQNFVATTDTTLQDFSDAIRNFKNQLITSANDALNQNDREAIAAALEKEKERMLTLANTQIGGQYIFSGSATSVKPFDENGLYHGNEGEVKVNLGEGVSMAYNIDGGSLFLGHDDQIHKEVATNVTLKRSETGGNITAADPLSALTGDETNPLTFQIAGSGHDGSIVKSEVTLQAGESMQNLLEKIGEAYGNTSENRSVEVHLDDYGHIRIKDLQRGGSQLELKLHATQNNNSIPFIDNGYTLADANNPDSAYFVQEGKKLVGNTVLIADGKLADATTKLSEIAHGSLDNKTFHMKVTDVDGYDRTVELNLSSNGSTFTVGGASYNIYNAEEDANGQVQTPADDMTLGQLDDIIAMTLSNTLPTTNDKSGYDSAVTSAKAKVSVSINPSGRMEIENLQNDNSLQFAFYDIDAGDMSNTDPSFALNSDNAVTTQKSQIDFFAQIDEVIEAVRNGSQSLDATHQNPRNIGIQEAIATLEQFDNHINKNLAKTGVVQNRLSTAQDRAQSMELSMKELKSQLTDVDIAEAYMNLNQLSLSYQAILSSVTKINNLTLLNYMK